MPDDFEFKRPLPPMPKLVRNRKKETPPPSSVGRGRGRGIQPQVNLETPSKSTIAKRRVYLNPLLARKLVFTFFAENRREDIVGLQQPQANLETLSKSTIAKHRVYLNPLLARKLVFTFYRKFKGKD